MAASINLGTDEFREFNLHQLRAIYAEARGLCVGAGRFPDAKAFDAFIAPRIEASRFLVQTARSFVQAALGQVSNQFAVNASIPPSEETLAWGGFLGGEVIWDHERSNEIILAILASARKEG